MLTLPRGLNHEPLKLNAFYLRTFCNIEKYLKVAKQKCAGTVCPGGCCPNQNWYIKFFDPQYSSEDAQWMLSGPQYQF